jgi:hypothetical protein
VGGRGEMKRSSKYWMSDRKLNVDEIIQSSNGSSLREQRDEIEVVREVAKVVAEVVYIVLHLVY